MPSKIQLDENLVFLYICLQKSDMKTIDFAAVGTTTNLKPPAARMRYTRLKRQIERGGIGSNASLMGVGGSDEMVVERERERERGKEEKREKKERKERKVRDGKEKREREEKEGMGLGLRGSGLAKQDGKGKRKRGGSDTDTDVDVDAEGEGEGEVDTAMDMDANLNLHFNLPYHDPGTSHTVHGEDRFPLPNSFAMSSPALEQLAFPSPRWHRFSLAEPHSQLPSQPPVQDPAVTRPTILTSPTTPTSTSQCVFLPPANQPQPQPQPPENPIPITIKLERRSSSSFSFSSSGASELSAGRWDDSEDGDEEDEMPLAKRRGKGTRVEVGDLRGGAMEGEVGMGIEGGGYIFGSGSGSALGKSYTPLIFQSQSHPPSISPPPKPPQPLLPFPFPHQLSFPFPSSFPSPPPPQNPHLILTPTPRGPPEFEIEATYPLEYNSNPNSNSKPMVTIQSNPIVE